MHSRYSTPCWLLIVLGSPLPAIAAADTEIDEIAVTASRLERPADSNWQPVQIIDRDEIRARQVPNLTELLRQLAGANVIQQGARGGVTSLVMRGGEPNFTVVMIDGVKVNDSTNTRGGSYDFSYIDINDVERVEVVRGPMSALYGSDALSGVVNIITRRRAERVAVVAEAGGHGLRSGSITLAGGNEGVSGMLAAHALSEDGDIEGSGYEDRGFDASVTATFGDDGEIGAGIRYQDADSSGFPEDSGGPLFAVIRDVDRRSVTEAHGRLYARRAVGRQWQGSLSLSRYDRSETAISPGIAPGVFDGVPPNSADTDFTRDQLLVSASRRVDSNFAVVIGAEWQREQGDSSGTIDIGFPLPTDFTLDRDTFGAFAEFDWNTGPIRLQGSVRRDDPESIGAEFSSKLGAIVPLPGENGQLRVGWGQGFKAPSFFALAHPLVGNPSLRSETAENIDLGYRKSFDNDASFEISLFRNEYENLIDFDPVLFTNVNRSRVVTRGVEVVGRFVLGSAVTIDAHLSYTDTDIRDSDARLRGRPPWRGGIVVDWQLRDTVNFTASVLALDEFWEVSIPTGGRFLDGYERVDLALAWEPTPDLTLGLAVDNALDADYEEAVGFPAAGLRGRLRASYRF